MKSKIMVMACSLAITIVSFSVSADDRFKFGGYFRSGTGATSQGGGNACFSAPGSSAKYRLGNECETYVELDMYYTKYAGARDNPETPRFEMRFTLAGATDSAVDNNLDNNIGFPNAYAKTKNFFSDGVLAGSSFWAGQRFYRRHDIHMNDYYYWDTTGVGGGVEDLDVGMGKLQLAYMQTTNLDVSDNDITTPPSDLTDVNDTTTHRLDFRLTDIDLGEAGDLTVGFDVRSTSGSSDEGADFGTALHLQHYKGGILNGYNKAAVQIGHGLSGGNNLGKGSSNFGDNDDWTFRVVDQFVWQPGESTGNWGGQASFVWEHQEKTAGGNDQDWIAIGVRPVYWFNQHLSLATELGYNYVKVNNGGTRYLTQIVTALQIGRERDYWSRPVLRLYGGYFNWNDGARDADGAGGNAVIASKDDPNRFGEETDGFKIGVQAEAWW